jgi:hypothetical protein
MKTRVFYEERFYCWMLAILVAITLLCSFDVKAEQIYGGEFNQSCGIGGKGGGNHFCDHSKPGGWKSTIISNATGSFGLTYSGYRGSGFYFNLVDKLAWNGYVEAHQAWDYQTSIWQKWKPGATYRVEVKSVGAVPVNVRLICGPKPYFIQRLFATKPSKGWIQTAVRFKMPNTIDKCMLSMYTTLPGLVRGDDLFRTELK